MALRFLVINVFCRSKDKFFARDYIYFRIFFAEFAFFIYKTPGEAVLPGGISPPYDMGKARIIRIFTAFLNESVVFRIIRA